MNTYKHKDDVKQQLNSENLMSTASVLKSPAVVVTYTRGHEARDISDFHHGADEILTLLGCDTVYVRLLATFWDSVPLPSSKVTYPP